MALLRKSRILPLVCATVGDQALCSKIAATISCFLARHCYDMARNEEACRRRIMLHTEAPPTIASGLMIQRPLVS